MDEGMKNVTRYYIPTFLSLSLLGNCLSVCVLFCTKLRYNSSSIYLGALAMSDIGVLVIEFIMWFQLIVIYHEYWMRILLLSSQNLFGFLSVWIVVAFTVQRYIAIKWPLLRHSLCTANRAKNVVIGLAGLAVLYAIPWFIYRSAEIKKSNAEEDMTNLILWLWILRIINFIITCIIPAIIIAIFNALIVYNTRKQNCIRRNLILCSTVSNENIRSSSNEASHTEVTKMLVIISSLFICLNTPIEIVRLYDVYDGHESCIALFFTDLLWLTNYGIDFVLYCATGKNFRTELIHMFTKSSDTRRSEDIEMENFSD